MVFDFKCTVKCEDNDVLKEVFVILQSSGGRIKIELKSEQGLSLVLVVLVPCTSLLPLN